MRKSLIKTLLKKANVGYAHFSLEKDSNQQITDGILTEGSNLFKIFTGLSTTESVNKSISEIETTSTKSKEWIKNFKTALLSGKASEYEQQLIDMNRWYSLEFTYPDASTCFVMMEDITEKKENDLETAHFTDRLERQKKSIPELLLNDVVGSGNRQETLGYISKLITETIGIDQASIWLFNEDRSELKCEALYNATTQSFLKEEIVLHQKDNPTYFEELINEKRVSADHAKSNPVTKELNKHYLEPNNIYSLLNAGIILDGKVAGMVSLENRDEPHSWYLDEEAFTTVAASVISQTFEKEEKRKTEAQLIEKQKELE